MRSSMALLAGAEVVWRVHWPEPEADFSALQAAGRPAHRRMIFEELFFLELGLELKRKTMRAQPGIAFEVTENVRAALKKILPFHPTDAQKKVLKEIAENMQQPIPMRRLLQGDVGSGKTIIALQAAIIAIENGYQVALMAPTEILATQHYLSARRILEPAGYRIVLLTGSLEEERKRDTRRHIARGDVQLVIGTHALIEEKVDVKAATKMYNELSKRVLPDLRVGLLHGRLDAEEKDAVMRRFQRGELDVLVATTVIEVGVDVPNANLMIVEHAERFGLSQLHQLRGRIGRGPAKSFCVLMTGGEISEESAQRLRSHVRTTNRVANADHAFQLRCH